MICHAIQTRIGSSTQAAQYCNAFHGESVGTQFSGSRLNFVRDLTIAENPALVMLDHGHFERRILVHGAKTTRENARNDWLDIGETNRLRILDAAYAVECWMSAE